MLTGLSQSVPAPDRVKPAVLPTRIGLIVALAGPFLVQFVLAPLILQSRVNPSTAVLLSQGTLLLLAATVIAITRWWSANRGPG